MKLWYCREFYDASQVFMLKFNSVLNVHMYFDISMLKDVLGKNKLRFGRRK